MAPKSHPYTRKPHHKVRTGCDNCKRRRLKCDEFKPACRRCRNVGMTCAGYNAPKTWLFDPNANTNPQSPASSSENGSSTTTSPVNGPSPLAVVPTHQISGLPALSIIPSLFEYVRSAYPPSEISRVSHSFQFILLVFGPCFIWSRYSNEDEQRSFAPRFLCYCLQDPALLEAVFALSSQQSGAFGPLQNDQQSLQHHTRSLDLLQKRLTSLTAVHDDTVFWTIIGILVLCQQRGDTESFAVHLAGLRQIVALRGGVETIQDHCPRAMGLFLWAESSYAQHQNLRSRQRSTADTDQISEASDNPIDAESDECLKQVTELPDGFQKLVASQLLRPKIHALASRTTEWFNIHTQTIETSQQDVSASDRAHLADALDLALDQGGLNPSEHLLCIGMFILLISLPPRCRAHRWPTQLNAHLKTLEEPTPEVMEDACFPWVALMVASIPIFFGLTSESRWWLLERYVQHTAGKVGYQEAQIKIEGFPQCSYLTERWPGCWGIAMMRVYPASS